MNKEQFKEILTDVYRNPFNEKDYICHLMLSDKDEVAKCRVILKKIKEKIENTLERWENASDKEKTKIESSITRDSSLYACTDQEISSEKTTMLLEQ